MGVGALDLALNFRQDQVVFAHSKADVCAKVGGKKSTFQKIDVHAMGYIIKILTLRVL